MIKTVQNISQSKFKRLNFYPSSNSPSKDTHAYISIYDNEQQVAPRINHPLWYAGIQLQFDDVDFDHPEMKLQVIRPDHAKQIVEFVVDLHQIERSIDLIIHCYAGISRSAGVGKWINDTFKLELPNYGPNLFHNPTVYSALNRHWFQMNGWTYEHAYVGLQ
jgi:predicted protein tyrosine phosphatase